MVAVEQCRTLVRGLYLYLVEPVIVQIFLFYYLPEISLVVRLMTQDSLFFSFRYLLFRLSFPFEPSSASKLAKYLVFSILLFGYYFLSFITWSNYPNWVVYHLVCLLTCPVVLENFLRNQVWILEILEESQKKLVNSLSAVCLAKVINLVCKGSLGNDPKISAGEMSEIVTSQNIGFIWTFLKIFLVSSLIKYLEGSGGNYYYGRILRTLYDRGSLISVPDYQQSMIIPADIQDPKKAKEVLARIIMVRKWHYFYDPQVLNLMIVVYQNQQGNMLEEIMTKIQSRLFQGLVLWSLADLIPLPFLALLFRLREEYPKNIVIPALDGFAVVLFGQQWIWLIAMVSEFSYFLDLKMLEAFWLKFRKEWLPDLLMVLFHQNKYNWYLFFGYFAILGLKHFGHWSGLLVLPIVTKYNFIYIWLVSLGYFSGFHFLHLFFLTWLMYFIINIVDIPNMPTRNERIELVKSYWADRTKLKSQ